ncbi:hypothetical protein F5B19DRAFT_469747 [Rostrohypoxylon terebratum]|nr:hypothetical protein F5B19DRAFT_469747 [Rostrohypoxylon terebratum]
MSYAALAQLIPPPLSSILCTLYSVPNRSYAYTGSLFPFPLSHGPQNSVLPLLYPYPIPSCTYSFATSLLNT